MISKAGLSRLIARSRLSKNTTTTTEMEHPLNSERQDRFDAQTGLVRWKVIFAISRLHTNTHTWITSALVELEYTG